MKVCVATGSRSEYGVLEPLIKRIDDDLDLELRLLVTGSHFSPEFGMTVNRITEPRYPDEAVEMLLSSDTAVGVVKSMGVGLISFADVLERMRPNLVIIGGDRFEMVAVALAAYTLRIPIVHISGGDVTEGSLDDAYRDCITRMAALNFPDTEQAHRRVCQIRGRTSWVHCVGSLSLDFTLLRKRPKPEDKHGLFLALHPADDIGPDVAKAVMAAIQPDVSVACLHPASDAGWAVLRDALLSSFDGFISYNSREQFFEALAPKKAIIGNSSAGIVEAPFLGTPSINIGNRQKGRPRASSIIDCEPTEDSIRAAIEQLNSQEFQDSLKDIQLAYTGGNVSEQIVKIIKDWWEVQG